MIDTLRQVPTPEGVELTLRLAGPVPRALAWMIDLILRVVVTVALALLLVLFFGKFGLGLVLILIFLVEAIYPILFEFFNDGATPGKKALGLRVIYANGTPVDFAGALSRNLLRAVDFLPTFYIIGMLSILLTRNYQRLGDLTANTIVVYRDDARTPSDFPDAKPTPPPPGLLLSEQQCIVDLARRLPVLTPERVAEIVAAAGPLSPSSLSPAERVPWLLGVAAWLSGARHPKA